MISLVYVSTSSGALGAEELAALQAQASRTNARCGVTGMLVYDGARFLQLLEGAERVVNATMGRIQQDSRHRDHSILRRDEITERECPDWSMRAIALPLTAAGSATEFACSLPDEMAPETRMLFTSFASSAGKEG